MHQVALDKKSNLEYLEREVNTKWNCYKFLMWKNEYFEFDCVGWSAQVFTPVRIERNETKGPTQIDTTALQKGSSIIWIRMHVQVLWSLKGTLQIRSRKVHMCFGGELIHKQRCCFLQVLNIYKMYILLFLFLVKLVYTRRTSHWTRLRHILYGS